MSDVTVSPLGPRAGGLRTIRIVLVLACLGVMVNSSMIVVLVGQSKQRISEINKERLRNQNGTAWTSTGAMTTLSAP